MTEAIKLWWRENQYSCGSRCKIRAQRDGSNTSSFFLFVFFKAILEVQSGDSQWACRRGVQLNQETRKTHSSLYVGVRKQRSLDWRSLLHDAAGSDLSQFHSPWRPEMGCRFAVAMNDPLVVQLNWGAIYSVQKTARKEYWVKVAEEERKWGWKDSVGVKWAAGSPPTWFISSV